MLPEQLIKRRAGPMASLSLPALFVLCLAVSAIVCFPASVSDEVDSDGEEVAELGPEAEAEVEGPLTLEEAAAAAEAAKKKKKKKKYLIEDDYKMADEVADLVKEIDWWKRTNYYHIYVRSFQDSDGDGNGDLRGIIQRLDYLRSIGIETLLMAPFYKSPMRDCGYDVSDYYDINPMYGTMQDFEDLMYEIKKRNMFIILDFVPNHSSDQHEWFKCSERAYVEPERCGKYRDYYFWVKPHLNASGLPDVTRPPNNWISCLELEEPHWMWTFSELRQEWYLHQFMRWQPDLNFTNPVVREEYKEIVRFWLRKGVDGLRVDAILHLMEDPQLRDNPPNPDWKPGQFYYLRQLHLYDRSLIESFQMLKQWRDVMLEPEFVNNSTGRKHHLLLIEAYDPPHMLQRAYGPSADQAWIDMPLGVELISGLVADNWAAKHIEEVALGWLRPLKEWNWPKDQDIVAPYSNWYTGNHDNSRLVDRVGSNNAITYQWLSYMLPGVPISYAGDETHTNDLELDKIPARALEDGDWRLTYRAPVAWNSTEPAGGFSDTADTWLPLPASFKQKNVRALLNDTELNQLKSFKAISDIRESYLPVFLFGDLVFFNTTNPRRPDQDANVLAMCRASPDYGYVMLLSNCDSSKPAWVNLAPARSLYEDRLLQPPTEGKVLAFNYQTVKNRQHHRIGKEISLQGFALMPSQSVVIRFLMYMLGKNIEPACFTEVVEDFAKRLPSRQKNGSLKGDPESA